MGENTKLSNLARPIASALAVYLQYLPPMQGIYEWRLSRMGGPYLIPKRVAEYCDHLSYCVFAAQQSAIGELANAEVHLASLPPIVESASIVEADELHQEVYLDLLGDLVIADGPTEWPGFLSEPCEFALLAERWSSILTVSGAQMVCASLRQLIAEEKIDWSATPAIRLQELLKEAELAAERTLPLLSRDREYRQEAAEDLIGSLWQTAQKVNFELPQYFAFAEQFGQAALVRPLLCNAHRDVQFWLSWMLPVFSHTNEFRRAVQEEWGGGFDGIEYC